MYGGYILDTSLDPVRGLASAGIPLAVDDQAVVGTGEDHDGVRPRTACARGLARLRRARPAPDGRPGLRAG